MAADINFYGLLYEFHRTSTNGADILITIEKKWYEGEVKQRALGRAPVIKRENKDHIFGTSCELYAECLVDGEYADMYTSDPYEFRVSVYKDETLLWQGFVSPELYSEPDAAPPYDVQITATDGLGELKNSIYEERGAASILSHIMGLIGQYPIYVISGLRYVDSTGAISQDHDILNVRINLDHEKGNSKYDVLQNLLTSLNANITQLNGRYVIFRETDFINKATDEGVEAFDVNGEKVYISIASFGSMTSHQWWPIGQLSTVVEPAKNSLVLQAPNHYKDNVLDFSQWSVLNSAEYDATEDAYILPDEGSYITQALDFDNEVGYRLGLRIRARNVGDSEEDQNIGLMIKVNARTYAAPEGRDFWLVKSEVSTGNARTDYLWRGQEDYFEEALNMPSDADTASDAQNVDIVIPLYDHSQNGLSYIFASSLSIKIFNPAGIHDIYVYDVSLVKYEQSEGYEAKVVINNAAREAESDIDLSMSSASFAPAAGNMFMTGLPMQADGLLIEQWQIPGTTAQEYLSAMSYDYARAVALPKMKYSGTLNVPDTASILPMLFLRDGTYYFPKTYTYDLYNDEIQVELISISAADVSLSSVVISQYAESSGNMGGVTTGGGGSGSVISLPRDKVMSDTSDNAVENKVIKKYVDDLRDQLLDLWHLDENGNIVTDKQVLIKNNLIVEKDTSSGGEGQDTPAEGTVTGIKVNGTPYGPNTQGVIDLSAAFNAIDVSDQLEDYYTKPETDSAISTAIAAIDLSIYAKSKDVYTKTQIDEIEEGIDTALATKAKQSDLVTLQGEVDNIETVLGLSETAEGYINTWAEVVAFLDGYKNADDLATILSGINADIAKNAEDIAALDNDKADKTTVTALAERVSVNEAAISDNAGNIKKNFDAIGALDKRVTAEEAVTTTYASWWADLKKWVTVEGDNVKISTNLIVTGDTSSGGSGSDTSASGTVTGVTVGSTDYTDVNAGLLNLTSLMNLYTPLTSHNALATRVSTLEGGSATAISVTGSGNVISGVSKSGTTITFTKGVTALTNITKSMVDSVLGGTTSSNANKFLMCTGSTTVWSAVTKSMVASALGASTGGRYLIDTGGYLGWGTIPTKLSQFTDDVVSGKYLPLSGGTLQGGLTISQGNLIVSGSDTVVKLLYPAADNTYALGHGERRWSNVRTVLINGGTPIHSGNIGSQNAGSATKLQTARTFWGRSFDGTGNVDGLLTIGYGATTNSISNSIGLHLNRTGASSIASAGIALTNEGVGALLLGGNGGCLDIYTYDGTTASKRMLINSSGNVTIGASDLAGTSAKLYVDGSISVFESLNFTRENWNYITAPANGGNIGFNIGAAGTSRTKMCVLNNGNILIGTTTDNSSGKLQIEGGATLNGYMANGAVSKIADLGEKGLVVAAGNSARNNWGMALWTEGNGKGYIQQQAFTSAATTHSLCLNPFGGNVGIGTTDPQYKLDVAGTGRFTGAVTMSSTLSVASSIIIDGNLLTKGNLILNTSATSSATGGVINFGLYGKQLTSDFSTSFKTSMFGSADNGARFRVARTDVTISNLCAQYGNALAWASNDTNGYLAVNYYSADPGAFIGGGNGEKLNWSAKLFHNKMSLVPNATNSYTLGTSSYQWSTIYGVNGIFSGDTSSGSDIRFKDIIKNKTLKIEHIAKAPLFTFKWNDREDDSIHLGSSAQYWEKVCPWLVTGEDFKSLNYATLGVAMGISLAKKAVNHEARITVLERKVKSLEEENRRLRYGN